MTYKELQTEIGKRLRELRHSAGHGMSPEEIARDAAERSLHIGSRTIRDIEQGRTNLSLDKLWILLQYYRVPFGDFFRFDSSAEDASLIADFLHVIKEPDNRKTLKTIISTFRKSLE